MSLETLLEAAEFLESRSQGQDVDITRTKDSDPDSIKRDTIRTKNGSGTREVHNKLEKNRRAHLKECFDFLKKNIPSLDEKRTSNLGILRTSLRYIQNLKRREREFEIEMHRFVHQKIVLQEKISTLKAELHKMNIDVDVNALVQSHDQDNETNSTSTATERGTPPPSDFDEHDDDEEEAETLALETNSPTSSGNKQLYNIHTVSTTKSPSSSQAASKTITKSDTTLTHKKAGINNKNGLFNSTTPYSNPTLMPQSVLRTLFSEAQTKKRGPVFPVAVTLASHDPSQGITVLRPVTNTSLSFGLAVESAQKLVEGGKVQRPPVTQLLQQTLAQRQAQQQGLANTGHTTTSQVTAPLTVAQLKSPPLSQINRPVTLTSDGSTTSLVVKDGILSMAKPSKNTNIIPQQKLALSLTGIPSSGSMPYYLGSIQKFAHPVLVTSLMTPATGLQGPAGTGVYESMKAATNAPINNIPAVVTSRSEANSQIINQPVINMQSNNAASGLSSNLPRVCMSAAAIKGLSTLSSTVPVAATSNVTVRHMLAPGIIPSQFAWPFLTIPGSQLIAPATTVSSSCVLTSISTCTPTTATVPTQSSTVSSIPVVSVTNLNSLTPIMTPMTVMSPGLQVTPTALTQAQLNAGVIGTPLLKQLQLPLGLQTSLLQTGQILGQQLVKPMVVVTVPNVATKQEVTTSITTTISAVSSSVL